MLCIAASLQCNSGNPADAEARHEQHGVVSRWRCPRRCVHEWKATGSGIVHGRSARQLRLSLLLSTDHSLIPDHLRIHCRQPFPFFPRHGSTFVFFAAFDCVVSLRISRVCVCLHLSECFSQFQTCHACSWSILASRRPLAEVRWHRVALEEPCKSREQPFC